MTVSDSVTDLFNDKSPHAVTHENKWYITLRYISPEHRVRT
jgi:hypothetical protein